MMPTTEAATLKTLVAFFHKGNEDELLRYLTEEDQKVVAESELNGSRTLQGLLPSEKELKGIHFSWILPTIKRYPEELQPFFIGALPAPIPKQLQKYDPSLPEAKALSPLLGRFFNGLLHKAVTKEERTPLSFIPENELSPLLQCSKKELIQIIDFLGLWDIVAEYKQIIDRRHLKSLIGNLSADEKEFLQNSLKSQPPPIIAPLPLHALNGNSEKLRSLLHRRGLSRFGIALSGRPEGMIWQITRTLDSGRAKILSKQFQAEKSKETTSLMTSQLITVINFLKSRK